MTKSCKQTGMTVRIDSFRKICMTAHHSLEADYFDEAIDHLSKRFCYYPGLSHHHNISSHAFLPSTTLSFHCWYPRSGFTPVVDVGFCTLEDFRTNLVSEGSEAKSDVGVKSVEEESRDEEEQEGQESERREL